MGSHLLGVEIQQSRSFLFLSWCLLELLLWQVLQVLGESEEDMAVDLLEALVLELWEDMVEAMVEIIMNSLTLSNLNMECMMTSITQTSVSTGLVMSTGILLESIR